MDTRDQLATWYLRLNGYFTMPNFIAHAHESSRTDVDVLAVRFHNSAEYPDDEGRLNFARGLTDICLVEVKAGKCDLNGPWKGKSNKQPLEYVLRRVGIFAEEALVDRAANEIYMRRRFPPKDEAHKWPFNIRIVCFGSSENKSLDDVTQILWPQAIAFIAGRFQTYLDEKADHNHWDSFGKFLWKQLSGGSQPSIDQLVADWKAACSCYP